MKSKTPAILLLVIVILFSCKQKNSSNPVTKPGEGTGIEQDRNATTSGTNSGKWSQKEIDKFIDQCAADRPENISSDDAFKYCGCVQLKIAGKYPDVQSVSKVSKDEMKRLFDDCFSGEVSRDDTDDETSPPWSNAEIKKFKDKCVPKLVSQLGAANARNYCDCMLEKIMVEYPDSKDAEEIAEKQILDWANLCAAKNK